MRAADRRLQEGGGSPSPLAQLARALSERGHAASEESSAPDAADAQTVIVGWFVKDGHQAAAGFAAARAVFAGQISPHFPFAESLRVRAEKEAGMPALAIPPLRDEKTIADAAAKIIAHFESPTAEVKAAADDKGGAEEKSSGLKVVKSESKAAASPQEPKIRPPGAAMKESAPAKPPESPGLKTAAAGAKISPPGAATKTVGNTSFGFAGASQLKPAQLHAAAESLKKGDLDSAEKMLPSLDERRPSIGDALPTKIAAQSPLARVLWLRLQIQLRQLGGAGAGDLEQIRRALTLMKRELPALSSEDLAQSGASEFTAALNARLNIGDAM